jgi:hypothetical protein
MRSRDQHALKPPQNGQCAVNLKPLIVATAVAASLSACSGGDGKVTLHGTYLDIESPPAAGETLPSNCADWEAENLSGNYSSWQVSVKVDNVDAGTTGITWTGKPVQGDINNSNIPLFDVGCTGSWSITVPAAHIAYSISVTGLSGAYTVQAGNEGKPIALTNGGS